MHWAYEATKEERGSGDESGEDSQPEEEETKEHVNKSSDESSEPEVHCPVKLAMWYFD